MSNFPLSSPSSSHIAPCNRLTKAGWQLYRLLPTGRRLRARLLVGVFQRSAQNDLAIHRNNFEMISERPLPSRRNQGARTLVQKALSPLLVTCEDWKSGVLGSLVIDVEERAMLNSFRL